jgi:hypothetical protein
MHHQHQGANSHDNAAREPILFHDNAFTQTIAAEPQQLDFHHGDIQEIGTYDTSLQAVVIPQPNSQGKDLLEVDVEDNSLEWPYFLDISTAISPEAVLIADSAKFGKTLMQTPTYYGAALSTIYPVAMRESISIRNGKFLCMLRFLLDECFFSSEDVSSNTSLPFLYPVSRPIAEQLSLCYIKIQEYNMSLTEPNADYSRALTIALFSHQVIALASGTANLDTNISFEWLTSHEQTRYRDLFLPSFSDINRVNSWELVKSIHEYQDYKFGINVEFYKHVFIKLSERLCNSSELNLNLIQHYLHVKAAFESYFAWQVSGHSNTIDVNKSFISWIQYGHFALTGYLCLNLTMPENRVVSSLPSEFGLEADRILYEYLGISVSELRETVSIMLPDLQKDTQMSEAELAVCFLKAYLSRFNIRLGNDAGEYHADSDLFGLKTTLRSRLPRTELVQKPTRIPRSRQKCQITVAK